MELFNILNSESCYSDPRVLKASLTLLATALYNMESTTSQQKLLSKAIISLVKIMDDENRPVALDCKSLSIVLESFDNLLAHDQIGTLVTASVSLFLLIMLKEKVLILVILEYCKNVSRGIKFQIFGYRMGCERCSYKLCGWTI